MTRKRYYSYLGRKFLATNKEFGSSMGKYSWVQEFITQRNKCPYFHMLLIHTLALGFCTIVASVLLDMMPLCSLMQKEPVFSSVVLLFVMPGRSWAFSAVPELQCSVFPSWAWKTIIFRKKNSKRERHFLLYWDLLRNSCSLL